MSKTSNLAWIPVLLSLLITGCGSTNQLAINIVEPAPVSLSDGIKRIGIVNTYSKTDNTVTKTGLDMLVAADDDYLSEKGTNAAIEGLFNELLDDPRFNSIVRVKEGAEIIQSEGDLPSDQSWETIHEICERYDLDAIFAMAYYQADTQLTLKKTRFLQRDLLRMQKRQNGHELTLETLIENGWRIYDPYKKLVLDEFVFKEQLKSTSMGESPLQAYRAIGSIKDSLLIKSHNTGKAYGMRLKPFEKTIFRPYYAQGTDNFQEAQRQIENDNLEEAIALWKKELSNDKTKLQAMACHNLAVAYEYLEDLEGALDWAQKSYEHQKNKDSKLYIEELQQRIPRNLLVKQQLSNLGS